MNIELQMLIWSLVLGIVQVLITATASTQQRGLKWNLSSRDDAKAPLTGVAGRLGRALENFKETFPFFLGAIVVTQLLSKNNSTSALGAQLYFWGRLLYLPIYAFNITVARTLIWTLSMVGIALVLSAAF